MRCCILIVWKWCLDSLDFPDHFEVSSLDNLIFQRFVRSKVGLGDVLTSQLLESSLRYIWSQLLEFAHTWCQMELPHRLPLSIVITIWRDVQVVGICRGNVKLRGGRYQSIANDWHSPIWLCSLSRWDSSSFELTKVCTATWVSLGVKIGRWSEILSCCCCW